MEAFFNFFNDADTFFNTINQKIIVETWGSLAEGRPFFTAMFTIILIVYFLRVALGLQRNSLEGVAWNVLMMTFAFTAFVSWDGVYPEFREALVDGPRELGLIIVNKLSTTGEVGNFGDALRDITQKATTLSGNISNAFNTGFSGPIIAFAISVLMGIAIVFMVFSITAVLLFAKFLTALMLALAPLAVIPLFFQSISFLFQGWLRVLLGGLLMQLIAYIVVGIIVVFLTEFIQKAEGAGAPDGDSAVWVVFGFLLYGAFVVLFTVLVPVITNAILTGTGVNTAVGSIAGRSAISPAASLAGGLGGAVVGGSRNVAATARDKVLQSAIDRPDSRWRSAAGRNLARVIRASMGRSPSLYANKIPVDRPRS